MVLRMTNGTCALIGELYAAYINCIVEQQAPADSQQIVPQGAVAKGVMAATIFMKSAFSLTKVVLDLRRNVRFACMDAKKRPYRPKSPQLRSRR